MTVLFSMFLLGLVGACLIFMYRFWNPKDINSPIQNSLVDAKDLAVFLIKRDEIESDPYLGDSEKKLLRGELESQASLVMTRQAHTTQASGFKLFNAHELMYASVGQWSSNALQFQGFTQIKGLSFTRGAETVDPNQPHPGTEESIAKRVLALEERLKEDPNNLQGWVLLARSKAAQRDFSASVQALEHALALAPGHPDLLTELADMLAMTQDKSMAGRPITLVNQALSIDPQHEKALALAATEAMQRGDQKAADRFWAQLKAVQGLSELKASAPLVAQGTVHINSELIQAIRSRLTAQSVVYVSAKRTDGTPMPLAVYRIPANTVLSQGMPFSIDDNMRISDSSPSLFTLTDLLIEARLSLSGQAVRASGDLISAPVRIKPGQSSLQLELNQQIP